MRVTGPIFDTQRFSIHDGPGIRTTVFLQGCPLRCAWCQNPEGQQVRADQPMPEGWATRVVHEVCADRAFFEVSGGGLTLSGGEPLLDEARAVALLQAAKQTDLNTCVQTCGAVPTSTLLAVLPLVDLFQFDLKHVDDAKHRQWTGVGTSRIHRHARLLVEQRATVQFRMPVLPGLNDGGEHLDRIAGFLAGLGVSELRLVPYHRHYLAKYESLGREVPLPSLLPPTVQQLEAAARRLTQRGLEVHVDGA